MTFKELEEYILELPHTKLTFPFGEDVSVYKVFIPSNPGRSHVDAVQGGDGQSSESYIGAAKESDPAGDIAVRDTFQRVDSSAIEQAEMVRGDWKMFALLPHDKTPVSISLKCDPQLAQLLREKYESIMEGYHLNKRHWNTMLMTDQLTDQEVQDLILHSYNLVIGNETALPEF